MFPSSVFLFKVANFCENKNFPPVFALANLIQYDIEPAFPVLRKFVNMPSELDKAIKTELAAADEVETNSKVGPYQIHTIDLKNRTVTITLRADVIGTASKLLMQTSGYVTGKIVVPHETKKPSWISLESLGAKMKYIGDILFGEADPLRRLDLADVIIGVDGNVLKSEKPENSV